MANTFIDARKTSKEHKMILIFAILGIVLFVYLSARGNYYLEKHPGKSILIAFLSSLTTIGDAPFAVSFQGDFLKNFVIEALITTFFLWCVIDTKILNRHYTDGEQCGTAKWQTPATIKKFNKRYTEPYGEPFAKGNENTIFSKNCQFSMNTRHTGLNNNVMVIGGPGSGKSFNIVRPNLLQAPKFCSNVVLDPSAELMQTTGKFFEEQNFDIRVFNLTDMSHSHRYNPFRYLRKEEDVLTLIECFIKNTETPGKTGGDQFWESATRWLMVES